MLILILSANVNVNWLLISLEQSKLEVAALFLSLELLELLKVVDSLEFSEVFDSSWSCADWTAWAKMLDWLMITAFDVIADLL